MRVVFLHVKSTQDNSLLPTIMAKSVKKAMPNARLIQMSDRKTPIIDGADEIWRDDYTYNQFLAQPYGMILPNGLMVFRMRMLSKLDDKPTVILDTDTVVQHDLSSAFDDPFDIGLTERTEVIKDQNGHNMVETMPFNTGVMFSRSARFWRDCLDYVRTLTKDEKDWTGDQLAVAHISKNYRLKRFTVDPWNYSPSTKEEDISGKKVVHYKGRRKTWMIEKHGS